MVIYMVPYAGICYIGDYPVTQVWSTQNARSFFLQYVAHSFSQEIIYTRKLVYSKFLYVQIITVERWISVTSSSIFLNHGA